MWAWRQSQTPVWPSVPSKSLHQTVPIPMLLQHWFHGQAWPSRFRAFAEIVKSQTKLLELWQALQRPGSSYGIGACARCGHAMGKAWASLLPILRAPSPTRTFSQTRCKRLHPRFSWFRASRRKQSTWTVTKQTSRQFSRWWELVSPFCPQVHLFKDMRCFPAVFNGVSESVRFFHVFCLCLFSFSPSQVSKLSLFPGLNFWFQLNWHFILVLVFHTTIHIIYHIIYHINHIILSYYYYRIITKYWKTIHDRLLKDDRLIEWIDDVMWLSRE